MPNPWQAPEAKELHPPSKPQSKRSFEKDLKRISSAFVHHKEGQISVKLNSEYRTEETVGIALAQRLYRLQLEQQRAQDREKRGREGGARPRPTRQPPNPSTRKSRPSVNCTGSTTFAWGKYARRSPSTWYVLHFMVFRRYRDKFNHTRQWGNEQQLCANMGDCCGRSCGCRKKPLHSYIWPETDQDTSKTEGKIAGVYGHCTAECACCIQFRQCYMPHRKLPDSTTTLLR
ncbi:hypothetical protein BO71DRAFT_198942 [Aspergillus ellipticus CBS 707.79]|uniref:Uncharacterized protein n=1 Tax=Aspergillus ellipticus CBS 707.79 TaxID=1448320 RepID=A0A319DE91_9EURO|nr:hypothetical protein BO71DRAFT_198942 [Aspergillus ellipticus CBS 707.79]